MTPRLYLGTRNYWINIYFNPKTGTERCGSGLFVSKDTALAASGSILKLVNTINVEYELSVEGVKHMARDVAAAVDNLFIPGW